jgi:steroid delta-isomerase-like uncharacterized protein
MTMTTTAVRTTLALALAVIAACACAQPSTRSTTMNQEATTRDQNRHEVETLFQTFNDGDLGRLDQLIAPQYVGPRGDTGPAGFREVIAGLRTAFPDLHYAIDDLVAEADQVAVRWHWTGTHTAPFRGYAPTGKRVTNPGMAIFRLKDGKIVAGALETDRLGFLQQIGVVPPNAGLGPAPAGR